MPEIGGRTKVVALIGHPVAHSPIPRLANAAFETLTLSYAMVPFDVGDRRLKDSVASVRSLGLAGLCVSMPHKLNICEFLDELGPTSQTTGSVDTVSLSGSRLVGHNTELWSFLSSLKDEGLTLNGKRVLLNGAGGTARSIAGAALKEGAAALTVCNRTQERSERLVKDLSKAFPAARVSAIACEPGEFRKALTDSDLLVNATPSGLESAKGPLLQEKDLHPALVVFDAAYTPATPLLVTARRVGCTAIGGTRMLLWQVFYAVRQWTGEEPPRQALERAMEQVLGRTLSPA